MGRRSGRPCGSTSGPTRSDLAASGTSTPYLGPPFFLLSSREAWQGSMDGVPCRWRTTRAQESFSRCRPTTGTLSRLAKLVAHAEQKTPDGGPTHKQHPDCHSFPCPECGQEFPNMTERLLHQELTHALPKPHKCLSCGQEFSLLSTLQLHRCAPSPDELDSVCVGGASEPDSPREKPPGHQPIFIDSIPYACAPCGRGFSQKQALLQHQQAGCSDPSLLAGDGANSPLATSPQSVSEAGLSRSVSPKPPGSQARYMTSQCPLCPKMVRSGAGLHSHMRKWHAGALKPKMPKMPKMLSCRSCEMVFKSTATLYLHRKEHHSREAPAVSTPRRQQLLVVPKRRRKEKYPCAVCDRVFLHHLSLRAHSKMHTATNAGGAVHEKHGTTVDTKYVERRGRKPHNALTSKGAAAPGGPKNYGRKMRQPGVRAEDEVGGEFPCPSCARVFSVQSELRTHVELHQSSANWRQCSVCLQEMDASKGSTSKKRRLYHCVPCQQSYSVLDTFLKHCQDHLRVKVEEDSVAEAYAFHSNKN